MLTLVHGSQDKKAAQETLQTNLIKVLNCEGTKNIGFPSGNVREVVYSAGDGNIWCAFSPPFQDTPLPRYWNPFGFYSANKAQTIVVEINIPSDTNDGRVAGFFAKDSNTGDIILMHNGRLGGGRPGIGKTAFLEWSNVKLMDVECWDGKPRRGVAIGKLDDPNLLGRIWEFVRQVHSFKVAAAAGLLGLPRGSPCRPILSDADAPW